MNQRVDIEKYLEEFRSSITRLEGNVAELTEDNARLNRRVEALNIENRSLKSENAELKEKLSKYEASERRGGSAGRNAERERERQRHGAHRETGENVLHQLRGVIAGKLSL